MRRFRVVPALFVAAALHAQNAPEWKAYSFPSDGFRVSFPAQASQSKQNVNSNVGPVELRLYVASDASVSYLVGVVDYPDNGTTENPDVRLQRVKQGSLANAKLQLVSEKKMMLGVYHGLEFEGESNSARMVTRAYFVGGTLYQTGVVWPAAAQRPPDMPRFLDSFQIIPRVRG